MRTQLPIVGISRDEIFSRMKAFSAGDIDWRRGRVPLYVFKANDEIATLGRDAFLEFFTENALGGKRAFHGLKKMEDDIVSIGLSLFHAPDDAAGFFTTGGSESIIAAVLACRDFGRRQSGRADKRGNIVLPYSAHPAFTKAARLMDIELRRIPVAANYRADVAAMSRAIDADTMMLVGSAPCFSYGTIDPIVDLGRLAQERGVWLHVDACVGGYIAPFAAKAGYPIPTFDFARAGRDIDLGGPAQVRILSQARLDSVLSLGGSRRVPAIRDGRLARWKIRDCDARRHAAGRRRRRRVGDAARNG